MRRVVNESLEVARAAKTIGAPLTAQVTIMASGQTHALLMRHASELPMLFVVSTVSVSYAAGIELAASAVHATGEKCPRCWRYVADVVAAGLCARCAEAVGSADTTAS